MRCSARLYYKMPKNMGVAPRYDVWNEKYEPWDHMKRMGRLVGTGFYIPPEWYTHFRMFPPINHNFQQERTLNPSNEGEPTQDGTHHLSAERVALRDELARRSRLVASEGMRYYNIFWVRKPLDRMEREYYNFRRKGVAHAVAIKKVLQTFYDELTVKKRVAAIQAEEAKLSGKFITMREATVVMTVLTQLQRERLTPHQAALLARTQRDRTHSTETMEATVSRVDSTSTHSTTEETAGALSAASLADLLADPEDQKGSGVQYKVDASEVPNDNTGKLHEMAMDATGDPGWYTGASLMVDLDASLPNTTGST